MVLIALIILATAVASYFIGIMVGRRRKEIKEILKLLEKTIKAYQEELAELDAGADPRREQPEQVEIQHVGYDADQLGRNK